MEALQRNQLVWLQSQAWQKILVAPWDAQALDLLNHWSAADLPLVITRQRAGVPPDRVCLGLPAPTRWARRRLALDVEAGAIEKTGLFPALGQVLPAMAGPVPTARVYGSYGWQFLTGLDYVHPASDLDVLQNVACVQEALQCARAWRDWSAPCRLDGELVFPGGHAVAWRELLQAHAGAVRKVLVKHRTYAGLMTLQDLCAFTAAKPATVPAAAVA